MSDFKTTPSFLFLVCRLVEKYNQIDCDVTDLQVNNIKRPYEYENAIKAKEAAREDIEVRVYIVEGLSVGSSSV